MALLSGLMGQKEALEMDQPYQERRIIAVGSRQS
jgi:hypothetical protein